MNTDYRSERKDRAEEQAQTVYEREFAKIEAALIAGAIAEGADENYKPDGAEVDKLVKLALQRRNDD